MNFLKRTYENIKHIYENYSLIPYFIYFNFYNKYIYLQCIFNVYLIYNLYTYRYLYISNMVDIYFNIKIKMISIFPKNKSFLIQKILLYTNLEEKYDITKYLIIKQTAIGVWFSVDSRF